MIVVDLVTDTIEAILDAAVATEPWADVQYAEVENGIHTRRVTNSKALTGVVAVTLIPTIAGVIERRVSETFQIYNRDTAAIVLTIRRLRAATPHTLWRGSVPAGGSLLRLTDGSWLVLDSQGLPIRGQSVIDGHLEGGLLAFATVGTITIGTVGEPSSAADSTDTSLIRWNGTLGADLAVAGAGGLDTGAEAPSTLYSVYVIADSSATNSPAAVFSASHTAPTLPAGYDLFRRLGSARNNAASALLTFEQQGAGRERVMRYTGSAIPLLVLVGVAAIVFTPVSCAAFVPPGERMVDVAFDFANTAAADEALFQATGDPSAAATTLYRFRAGIITTVGMRTLCRIPVDAASSFNYAVSQITNVLTLAVASYSETL